jgi:tyrosinase
VSESPSTAGASAAQATPSTPYIRREVRALPAGDPTLTAYAEGVRAMKARSATDPTSWAYQAAIHGTHASPLEPLWNQCRHGTWYFVAWHRMFVYYFERIVRAAIVELGGPADWALPYWDYGRNGEYAKLPNAFREPADASNPLYVQQRVPAINAGGELSPRVTTDTFARSRPHFTGATEFGGGITSPVREFWKQTGRLEATPHNDVHAAIGGEEGWMNDPEQAAEDPIFWLHHTNIDRIWALWISEGHTNPTDNRWTEQRFEFYDVTGLIASKSPAEVLDTVADLGYTYDQLSGAQAPPPSPVKIAIEPQATVPPPKPPEPHLVGATAETVTLVGNTAHIPVAIDARARDEALAHIVEPSHRRIFLNIEDVEADRNPGSVYGIYVNAPPKASLDELALHHAGNLSFFGIERARDPRDDEHAHGLRVSMDITELVEQLKARGQWDDGHLQVTLHPIEVIPPGASEQPPDEAAEGPGEDPPVHIGRVSVSFG